MTEILIKPQYHNTVIAFNNSGVVLKDRTTADVVDLGIMAHQSGNPNLLILFEKLPSLQELQQQKLTAIEKRVMANEESESVPVVPGPPLRKDNRNGGKKSNGGTKNKRHDKN